MRNTCVGGLGIRVARPAKGVVDDLFATPFAGSWRATQFLLQTVLPFLLLLATVVDLRAEPPANEKHPLSEQARKEIRSDAEKTIRDATEAIKENAKNLEAYSRRGDAYFFTSQFAKAVADYDRMIELDPAMKNSHWRRGIALFYDGKYEEGAKQFEAYHSFDDVDRENGIWRYLCQRKAFGLEKARAGLLKYKKDDREPFPDVYRLFAGEISPDEILKRIDAAKVAVDEREKRRFYAELYIGLNEFAEGRNDSARAHLRKATANKWGPEAGYGPNYMWHVGRVQYEILCKPPAIPQ